MRDPKGIILTVLLAAIAPIFYGCGGGSGGGDESSSGASATSACSVIGFNSSLKIANGEQCLANSGSDTSAVVRLSILTSEGAVGTCTGTVISPRAVLTAAHCFAFDRVSSVRVVVTTNGVKRSIASSSLSLHPEFRVSPEGVFFNDVAVVRVAEALPVVPVDLLSRPREPRVNEEVVVAGYGQRDSSGGAEEEVVAGRAVVRVVTENHIRIDYREGESHPCRGDSGGALFVEQDSGQLAVVGVVSQSDPSVPSDRICEEGDMTLYANIQEPGVAGFIEGRMGG
jgi:secreted trypsin-like serine protease